MKIQFKRIVSAVCALALCASMMPASALAEPVVSGGDTAIVQQVEEDTSVPVTETTDETTEPVDVADTAETETDTAQPAEDASESEATEPETSTQPEETEQSSADVSVPEAAAADEQAPIALANGVETYASYNIKKVYDIKVGETLTISGVDGWDVVSHGWSIEKGDRSVISFVGETDERNVTIKGEAAGTVILCHSYYSWGSKKEYFQVNVDNGGQVFLFIAKPSNTTLSSNGSDYYFLTYGGNASEEASADMKEVIDQTNEEKITKYVASWPTDLKTSITNTSSDPVGSRSTWTINPTTGEVESFTLVLGDKQYSSSAENSTDHKTYGIRWAKFSYASTGDWGDQYHADAILYEKVTVEDVIVKELKAAKQLSEFSLNASGVANTSETFKFKLISVDNSGNQITGGDAVDIELTATVNAGQLNTRVLLDAGKDNEKELVPGRYKLYEDLSDYASGVWQTPNVVVFEVNTDGSLNIISGGSADSEITITNTLAKYTLSYDLKGGNANSAFDQVTGLKYNEKRNVTATIPTKDASVFLGWSTDPNATAGNPQYAPGEEITITGNVTLYAVWGRASAAKSPVTGGTDVSGTSIDLDDYADISLVSEGYVSYTADNETTLLYQIKVNGYAGAKLTIADTPDSTDEMVSVSPAAFVAVKGATKADDGSFTMTAANATLYYSVMVSNLDQTSKVRIPVSNSAIWTISSGTDTQHGTVESPVVTIIKTENSLSLTKKISSVLRGGQELDSSKSYNNGTILRANDVVTYEITITNNGKAKNDAVIVQDTFNGVATSLPAKITIKTGSGATIILNKAVVTPGENGCYWVQDWTNGSAQWCVGELDVGETATITYTYTVQSGDVSVKDEDGDYSKLTNAVATIDASGLSQSTYNFVEGASIGVDKTGTVADNGASTDGGMLIKYKVTVTNNGNTNLKTIELTDAKFPAGNDASKVTVKANNQTVSAVSLSGTKLTVDLTGKELQPGQAMTVEYTYAVQSTDGDTVHNDVAVTATTVKDLTATGDGSADVNVYEGTITVAPASIVVYTGGKSDQSVVDGDGTIVANGGIPTLGFTFRLNGKLVEFTAEDTNTSVLTLIDISGGTRANYSWTGTLYNDNAKNLLQLDPTAGAANTDPVRIQLTDPDAPDKVFTNDEFEIGEDLYKVYNTAIFTNTPDGQTVDVVAKIDGKYYKVQLADAELSIRGTTSRADSTVVSKSEEELKDNVYIPQAVVPEDAKFYYVGANNITNNGDNEGSLAVADTSSVSLLVDEIVDQTDESKQEYVQMMKDRVEADSSILGAVPADTARLWRFYYMDLVLANNGNAVLTTDKDVEIYWPYPDGVTYQDVVDGKYTFTVLHYTGLNRNYESGKFDQELKDCNVEKYTVTPTENGLKFTVPSADGFSPYALVYEYSTKGPDQTVTVEGDDHPDIAEAIANGTWGQPTPTPAPAVIPQTSDDMPLGMLIGVAAVAAAALVVLTVLRRRRRKQ